MNIPDNVSWLEDFANESFLNGNTVQSERLWLIAKWITEADSLTQSQNEFCNKLGSQILELTEQFIKRGVRLDKLSRTAENMFRENEYLQQRIAQFVI